MSDAITQMVDAQSRITLPRTFAKSKVVLEEISPGEIRIRKAVAGRKPRRFAEESSTLLSDADRDRFLQLLEQTPRPNTALKKLMSRRGSTRG